MSEQHRRNVAAGEPAGNTVSDLIGQGIEPKPPAPIAMLLPLRQPAGFKGAIRAKKVASKAWLANKLSVELRSQIAIL